MAKIPPTQDSKIEVHGEGTGLFTRADVERRAREIAEVDNRARVTPEDRVRARAELTDRALPAAVNEDADSMQSLSRDPSDPATDRGHQVPEYVERDEKTALERLALEGVEEAQHDQMLGAHALDESGPSEKRRRPPTAS